MITQSTAFQRELEKLVLEEITSLKNSLAANITAELPQLRFTMGQIAVFERLPEMFDQVALLLERR